MLKSGNTLYLIDGLAFGWFLLSWIGYTIFSGYRHRGRSRMQDGLHEHIKLWIDVLRRRELRIVDTAVIASIERNASFFASSTLLIIAGLITAMGSIDKAINLMSGIPLIPETRGVLLELVLLILILNFAYAFFTFTWSMRQYSFAAILVGNMPLVEHEQPDSEANERQGNALAEIVWLAIFHFNQGLRAYYFSLALLTWLIHPFLFMLTTSWVVLVLFRREFHSRTLRALLSGLPESLPKK